MEEKKDIVSRKEWFTFFLVFGTPALIFFWIICDLYSMRRSENQAIESIGQLSKLIPMVESLIQRKKEEPIVINLESLAEKWNFSQIEFVPISEEIIKLRGTIGGNNANKNLIGVQITLTRQSSKDGVKIWWTCSSDNYKAYKAGRRGMLDTSSPYCNSFEKRIANPPKDNS